MSATDSEKVFIKDFRDGFPAFSAELFTDRRILFWYRWGKKVLDERRFGGLYEEGLFLFVAHNLTLEKLGAKYADGTGGAYTARGLSTGAGKSAGPLSKNESYNPSLSLKGGEGQYALTIYGQQLYQMILNVGAGGLQL